MIDTSSVLSSLSFVMVFIEGLVSFFSPCVIPMIPIYMGYLAGKGEDGTFTNSKKKIFLFTICFIIGIFSAIFVLNMSLSLVQHFFKEYTLLIARLGGILIIILGIYQLGIFKFLTLKKTYKVSLPFKNKMNIIVAFLMGFTFGFAWTPCIGPALSSILLLAASANNFWISNLLIVIYALGFTLPFLALGLFTETCLQWITKHKKIMLYTTKIGAVILLIMGLMMFTGKLNTITSYLSDNTDKITTTQETPSNNHKTNATKNEETGVVDFTLTDQNNNSVQLSNYRGKVIFLNFWATWCPPCRQELPHVQSLYEKYKTSDEVVVLTVVLPGGQEKSKEGIIAFLDDNKYTMPVLFDTSEVYSMFGIASMPTTFMIDKEGVPFGYVQGQISPEIMENIIQQTLQSKESKE